MARKSSPGNTVSSIQEESADYNVDGSNTDITDQSDSKQQLETPDDDGGQENQDANTAARTSGAEDEVESTLADVIRDAVKPKEDDKPESSDRKDGQDKGKSEGEDDKGEDDKSDADANKAKDEEEVPFHKHPRWQEKLKKERELTRERDQYKQGHDEYGRIDAFMRDNELAPEEVANGFQIMAMMRSNPDKALEALRPFIQQLETVTGKTLPDDLQVHVSDGTVTAEVAAETARLRQDTLRQTQQAERAEASRQSDTQRSHVQSIQSAASAVEKEIESADPDYARKQPFVLDRVRSMIAENPPKSPDEARAIVRKAHVEISDRLRHTQRKQVTPVRSTDTTSPGKPQPKTFAEAVRMAANQT